MWRPFTDAPKDGSPILARQAADRFSDPGPIWCLEWSAFFSDWMRREQGAITPLIANGIKLPDEWRPND